MGLAGAGGREAFGDLFQIAVRPAWARERDGEPIRNPRAFPRQVIINRRKMQLRTAPPPRHLVRRNRCHRRRQWRQQHRRDPRSGTLVSEQVERREVAEIVTTADGTGGSGIDAIADRSPSVSEQVERREVAEIVTHILITVERRARTVWAMRWLEERTPDEVVAALGITHRQYARLLERANTAINRKLLAYLAGDWCPGHAARFARLAANRATAAEARDAREHLDACPSCRTAYETFTRLHPSGA